VVSFAACSSAVEKAKRWDLALQLQLELQVTVTVELRGE
jgi:hypothetical protein